MPDLSAAREVLICRSCGDTMLILTVESPQPVQSCLEMLNHLADAFKMREATYCLACLLRQQLAEAPVDA